MEKTRPGVLIWYRIYCGLMALMYFALAAMSVVGLIFRDTLTSGEDPMPPAVAIGMCLLLFVISLVFGAVYVAPFFLPPRPWTWIYHLVLIAIGMTSPCCLPVSVLLLIYWVNPATRAYFGRGD